MMKNGICINCGSQEVFKSINGIISGDKHVFVRNLSKLTSRTNKMTYICTACGYYQNHIIDQDILNKVKAKWEKVTT